MFWGVVTWFWKPPKVLKIVTCIETDMLNVKIIGYFLSIREMRSWWKWIHRLLNKSFFGPFYAQCAKWDVSEVWRLVVLLTLHHIKATAVRVSLDGCRRCFCFCSALQSTLGQNGKKFQENATVKSILLYLQIYTHLPDLSEFWLRYITFQPDK